jgi:PAS domain S-box-containing protein
MKGNEYSTDRPRRIIFIYGTGVLTVFAFLMFCFFAYLSFISTRDNIWTSFRHTAEVQALAVSEWFNRTTDITLQITSRSRMREELANYNQGLISEEEFAAFTNPKLQDAMALSEDILGVIRLDRQGAVVASHGASIEGLPPEQFQFDAQKVLISPAFMLENSPVVAITAPISNSNADHLGYDVAFFKLSGLLGMLSGTGAAASQGTSFLVYPHGEHLDFLLHDGTLQKSPPERVDDVDFTSLLFAAAEQDAVEPTIVDQQVMFHLPILATQSWHVVLLQDQRMMNSLYYRRLLLIAMVSTGLLGLALLGFWYIGRPLAGKLLLHSDQLQQEVLKKTLQLENEILQRRDMEEQLRKSRARYKQIFAASTCVQLVIDPSTAAIIDANEAAVDYYGYGFDELVSMKFTELNTLPEKQLRSYINRILCGEKVYGTFRHRLANGGVRDVEEYVTLFEADERQLLYLIIHDVTARLEAEQAQADSEQLLSDIVELLPDATFVIDKSGRVLFWNRAIEEMTGVRKEEIVGRHDHAYALPFYGESRPMLVDLVLERDQAWEQQYDKFEEREGKLKAVTLLAQLGEKRRYVSATAAQLHNVDGEIVGAIESIRDITDAKQLEKEREELIVELQQALTEVKTLSGLLPICSSCKKIRDDDGYWNQIDSYISRHTEADFSHGICPDCTEKLYGKEDWYLKSKKKVG